MWTSDPKDYQRRVAGAEELGYREIGTGDSPIVHVEMLTSLPVACLATERSTISSMVAVPSQRHPVHFASAFSGLHDLSGGRFVSVLGTGGSAPKAVGEKPVKRERFRGYVLALRALLAGETVEWNGAEIAPPEYARPVKLYIASYGSASRKLAGEIGDGAVLATGAANPELPEYVEEVRRAARDAGRDPAEIDIWVMTRGSIADTRAEAIKDLIGNLASAGAHGLAGEAQLASVPEEYRDRLRELQRRYRHQEHTHPEGHNAQLVYELGLDDYLAQRFAMVGTPDECREIVANLEGLGVSTVHLSLGLKRPEELLHLFAEALITT
jgi:5,10-methylenetetrahydromethanopterin reductase